MLRQRTRTTETVFMRSFRRQVMGGEEGFEGEETRGGGEGRPAGRWVGSRAGGRREVMVGV